MFIVPQLFSCGLLGSLHEASLIASRAEPAIILQD
jgi:hypothetical protein